MSGIKQYVARRLQLRKAEVMWWLCMLGGVWGLLEGNFYGATWAFIAAGIESRR